MVFEQADVGIPRPLVRLDIGHVLVSNEVSEGGDRSRYLLLFKWVLTHSHLVADFFSKESSIRK